MSKTNPSILVFDSGVGGLTIAQEIRRYCPTVQINYLSDSAGFPYGKRPEAFVIERCLRLIRQVIENAVCHIDLVVIACNTASTLALPTLRENFTLPIIGVVPAVKPAAERSANHYFGLLATPATVKRPYTQGLIQDFAAHCTVVSVGSSELVQIAEDKLRGIRPDRIQLRSILQPLTEKSDDNPRPEQLDTIVLACTHFPLLRDEIREVLDRPVELIDSGQAIARRVQYVLDLQQAELSEAAPPGTYWFTQTTNKITLSPPETDLFGNYQPIIF